MELLKENQEVWFLKYLVVNNMTEDKEDAEVIKISIEPDSFKIQGRIPWEKKHTYILLAILCALLGISYEELSQVIGGI
jgi:hypothetical protein